MYVCMYGMYVFCIVCMYSRCHICFLYAFYMLPICFLYASRWYVGNSVRLACQGGDHSKESNLNFWQNLKFPRASERRVLPIVGVCISSSHLHICSSSHLLILTSSHLLLLPSCPLLLFYFSSEGGGRGSANETARNATLSHEMRFDRQKLM